MNKDEKLIADCLSGKRKAQSELYNRYAPVLYGICLRYASSHFEAQEMLQEGFIKVFSSLSSFSSKGSFEGWVKRIVVNNALNYIRSNSSQKLFADFKDAEEMADIVTETDESSPPPDTDTMLRLIQQLPEGYRMIFNLYVFENFTHKEIAETTGISENTSKTQLMRARQLLQIKISELPR